MSSSGGGEKVIELSVDETNKLRAKLGLAPLRTEGSNGGPTTNEASSQQQDNNDNEEVLEMSVNESNALREKLGLPPLRAAGGSTKQQQEQHAPAVNEGDVKATTARVEKAKLQRQVKEGAAQYGKNSLGDDKTSALSFAEEMRQRKKAAKKAKKEQKKAAAAAQGEATPAYGESDVKGLTVGHTVGDFQEGSTTVLTLADTEILTADEASKRATGLNDDEARLENVNLSEQQTIQEGLKEKRKMEMGMGRAGGYAGYDDDEFEELGGAQGPSRAARGAALTAGGQDNKNKRKTRGFQIGTMLDQQDEEAESDIFAAQSGKAISLHPSQTDRTMSDFMTAEEEAELRPKKEKKKKDKEFKKKKKKKDKKENKRKVESDDDEEEPTPIVVPSKKKSLADELEETAPVPASNRKRRRQAGDNGNDDDDDGGPAVIGSAVAKRDAMDKRAKYEAVMEKGNERTKAAFSKPKKPPVTAHHVDEEPDDAFLNAALAKARRLNRLKQLSEKSARGADAVAQSLEQSSQQAVKPESAASSGGGISFSIDDTREFTLALRVKKEQEKQQRDSKAKRETKGVVIKKEADAVKTEADDADNKPEPMTVDDAEEEQEDVDMNELAKEVKEDKTDVADILAGGGTATVGRGLGNFMQMLRQTGEISGKKTRREEQRGRARDERTEEDYAPLDLSSVVRIDERNANERDREFASREVKLEYRDEHGRLLTRKEAFRDMSQQFHGFSSGKRKSEKKMKQIAREQAEQRIASKQGTAEGGMLGALKATQKATGKAFVVHKM